MPQLLGCLFGQVLPSQLQLHCQLTYQGPDKLQESNRRSWTSLLPFRRPEQKCSRG